MKPKSQPPKSPPAETILDFFSALIVDIDTGKSDEYIIRKMVDILGHYIPSDRFTLQFALVALEYHLEDGQYTAEEGALAFSVVREDASASQWVALNKKPLLRTNINTDQRFEYDQYLIEEGMFSDLILPLIHNQTLFGLMNFTSHQPHVYTQHHLDSALAFQKSVAAIAKHLENRIEINAIKTLSHSIQRTASLNQILDLALQHLQSQGYDRIRLYLYDDKQNALLGAAQAGGNQWPEFKNTAFAINVDPYTQQTFKKNKPCIYQTNTQQFEEVHQQRFNESSQTHQSQAPIYKEWCEIPLQLIEDNQVQIIGKISLDNEISHHALVPERLNRLISYTDQLALTIRHAQLYEQAAHQKEHLETEVQIRTKELATTNKKLESKNEELERFSYTVSHDLKAPLVTIKGFLGLVEQDALSGNQERLKADLHFIKNATDNMENLLNDLLDLSRVGRITNPFQHLNLNDLIQDSRNLVAERLKKIQVNIAIPPQMPTLYGDRQRLLEVFQNLLDNAAKFMGDQNNPTIEINASIKETEAIISIKDNGIGIDPKYHTKIFGLFERLTPQIEGTGIGLTLVERIIHHHGGRIWLTSKGNLQGTTFHISLPLPTSSEPSASF